MIQKKSYVLFAKNVIRMLCGVLNVTEVIIGLVCRYIKLLIDFLFFFTFAQFFLNITNCLLQMMFQLNIPDSVPGEKWVCLRCKHKTPKRKRGRSSVETRPASLTAQHAPAKDSIKLESNSKCVPKQSPMPSTSVDVPQNIVKKPRVRSLPYTVRNKSVD